MAINLKDFVFEEDLQKETEEMQQELQKVQAENRYTKLKQSTAHIPIKELEKTNFGGRFDRLIVDRKSDEKVQEQLADEMASQKISQITGTTPLQREADKDAQKKMAKNIGDLKVEGISSIAKERLPAEEVREQREPIKPAEDTLQEKLKGFEFEERPLQEQLKGFEFEEKTPTKPERKDLLTDPLGTLAESGIKFVTDISQVVTSPIQTAKSIFSLAKGTVQKLIPGEQADEKTVDAVVDFYKERYGGLDKIKETALTDPIGFAVDLSMFLSGGGAAVTKVGKLAKVAKIAKTGAKIKKAAQLIDPLALTLRGAGKTVSKISKRGVKPFAKKVDPNVVAAAQELGIDIPASAKTTGKVAPLAETFVSKGFFGNKLDDMVESARGALVDKADDLIRKTEKSPDLTSAGLDMFKGAEKYRDRFIKVKNKLYETAMDVEKGGAKVIVKPKEALEFAEKILTEKRRAKTLLGSVSKVKFYENLVKKLKNPRGVNGQVYRAAIKELNEQMKNFSDPFVAGNKGILKKTTTILSNELDDALIRQRPDLSGAVEKANAFYADGIKKINNSYVKKIFELKDQPDKILPAILRESISIEDIPKVYEVIGKENVPAVRSAFLETVFKNAKNVAGDFTPAGLAKQLKKFGDKKLNTILTKEQVKSLNNIKEVSQSLGKFDKISKGSQTAFLARIASEASALFTNPILGLKLIGGDFLLSKFVTSKAGQKLLAEGLKGTGKTGEALAKSKKPITLGRLSRVLREVEE
jgi:hypothetical protein